MTTISYAITACNEHAELERLLDLLNEHIREEDEILVQLDSTATNKVKAVAEKYNIDSDYEYHRIFFPLNGDFAAFKNNIKNHCVKDYIFFIDADEYPSVNLIKNLNYVLEENPVDLILVPRVNTVDGITKEHIGKWGWNVDENKRVNWPDYQTRIVKNSRELYWENKVHEKIVGYKTISHFPFINEDWCLYHPKTIERQEKQNKFYETL